MTTNNPDSSQLGVIGVIPLGPRVLMVRRAFHITKGGAWCFPGGHVEPGETPEQALCREMLEELGVDVAPECRLGSLRVADGGYLLEVFGVRCADPRLLPNPAEIADIRWVRPPEIATIQPGLPSNACVLDMLPDDFVSS